MSADITNVFFEPNLSINFFVYLLPPLILFSSTLHTNIFGFMDKRPDLFID